MSAKVQPVSDDFHCQGCFDIMVKDALERMKTNTPPQHECGIELTEPKPVEAPPSNVVDLNNLIAAQVQKGIRDAFAGNASPGAVPAEVVSPGVTKAADLEPVKIGAAKSRTRRKRS